MDSIIAEISEQSNIASMENRQGKKQKQSDDQDRWLTRLEPK